MWKDNDHAVYNSLAAIVYGIIFTHITIRYPGQYDLYSAFSALSFFSSFTI